MKHFRYSAYRSDGGKASGAIEAISLESAYSNLQGMGLSPISLEEKTGKTSTGDSSGKPRRLFHDPQLVLRTIRMLAILISRQVSIPDALALTADAETSRYGTKLLHQMSRKVAEGQSLSGAMSGAEEFSAPYIVSMVSAGETTATLGIVLERLAEQLEKDQELKRKVQGAFAYPLVLIVASLGMLSFIALYLVPALMPLLEQSENGVPTVIAVMNNTAVYLDAHSKKVLLSVALTLAGSILVIRRPATRKVLEELWFHIPVAGRMLASSETVRFCSSLGLMLSNHVELVRALDISKQVARTHYFTKAIEAASPALKEGQSLDQAFAGYDRFPRTFNALARAGSETRALPAALEQIASVQRAILEKQIETAVKMLPPILTLLVGGFVGLFVLVIVDTIMSLNDAIY